MATAARVRGRTVRAAVADAISAAREDGRLRPWHEPGAAVALKVAAALTRKDVAPADLIRLSTELRKLLNELPLAPETTPKGGDDDERPDPPAGADAIDRELAEIVGSGPEVGNPTHA